ncbi:MAG: hypothetical protein PSX81_08315 [bacterium]|nr:hypothetical protein [bacterium]
MNGKYIFEIGGRGQVQKQIPALNIAEVVKDNLETPLGKTLPLWMFGWLY